MKETKIKRTKETVPHKLMNKFMEFGAIIGNQRHLSSIRDAFGTFLPFIIVGSIGVLINSVFISATGLIATIAGTDTNEELMESWSAVAFYISPIFSLLSAATMDIFSVYMAFLFGYFLSGTYGNSKIFGGMVSLAAFMALGPVMAVGGTTAALGTTGLLLAIAVGMLAPMLFNVVSKFEKLKIKMPDGVPPSVAQSFNSLIPVAITIGTFALIQPIWGAIAFSTGLGSDEIIVEQYIFTVMINYINSIGQLVEGVEYVFTINEGTNAYEFISLVMNGNLTIEEGMIPLILSFLSNIISEEHNGDWTEIVITSQVGQMLTNSISDIIILDDWYYFFNMINQVLFAPLANAANSPVTIFFVMLLVMVFWFFGIHGTNVLNPFIYAFWTTAAMTNAQILADSGSLDAALATGDLEIWTSTTMDNIVLCGGAGATLALITGILIFSKSDQQKTLAKIAAPVGVFNINEPVTFGLPIMLNPYYALPYILVVPIMSLVIYGVTATGWLNPVTIFIPWSTPPFIGGWLATQDWRAIIWTGVVFVVAFVSYLPFVIMESNSQVKASADKMDISTDEFLIIQKEIKIKEKNEIKNTKIKSNIKKYEEEINLLKDNQKSIKDKTNINFVKNEKKINAKKEKIISLNNKLV